MSTNTDTREHIIENANPDDVLPGDHITWASVMEVKGVTVESRRAGTAHHRDAHGNWRTKDSARLTDGEGKGITLTIRRTVRTLPTAPCAVIVANEGHEYITATFQGVTYYAREAVRDRNGAWRGAWRGSGRVKYNMYPSQIDPDCWKVDDQ